MVVCLSQPLAAILPVRRALVDREPEDWSTSLRSATFVVSDVQAGPLRGTLQPYEFLLGSLTI